VTHLRKMMLEELQRRNYAQHTTRSYIRTVEDFSSDQIEPFGKDNNLPRHGRAALPGEHLLCKQNNSHAKSLPRLR
jgi:hypothetical protein